MTKQKQKPSEVLKHIEIIHEFAPEGKLILASYGQDPATGKDIASIVRHFQTGEVEAMASAAIELNKQKDRNVYVPMATMRQDLGPGKKGGQDDVEKSFGLVADFDDDRASVWFDRVPIQPSFCLETSMGRFQAFFMFSQGLTPEDAKTLALRLQKFTECDHGTKDICHVWRVAGLLNWPNKKKVDAGRSPEPQLVKWCC